MALISNVTLINGLAVASAYIRVRDPVIVKNDDGSFALWGSLSIYQTADASAVPPQEQADMAELQTPQQIRCAYDLAGANPFEQAYAWLKTERYPDAADA